ncbi:MAG: beta-ketoacyl synthase N-terminal-like domain-containing protein [Limisphaerales bacterium]
MAGSITSVAVTGMGIVSSIGSTVPSFTQALRQGLCGITHLPASTPPAQAVQIGALVRDYSWHGWLETVENAAPSWCARARKVLNNTTESTRWSAGAAMQAFLDAGLVDDRGLDDVGLIVAGNNLSQEYMAQNWARFQPPAARLNPKYAISFFDSNQVGCLSEILGLRGMGYTIGAASASGNAALFQAFHWIRTGLLKQCLVVGAGSEFSALELEAFALLGAACHGTFRTDPKRACRPFDADHEGFVWGQGSAAVVLEAVAHARARGARILGELVGASLVLDGNHLPNPSAEGEVRAMQTALGIAGLAPDRIGYVNAHGTSSPLGDRTECAALKRMFEGRWDQTPINATKSLTGHCMGASGVIELVACLLQLNQGFLHPNINLERPVDPDLRFVGARSETHQAEYALSNGFGFGGINSSLVIRKGTT